MTNPESSGAAPKFPLDEAAPTLSKYWNAEPETPIHYSNLTPDPEATMDLKLWTRLHYQMSQLNIREEDVALAITPDVNISIDYPIVGPWLGDEVITYVTTGIGSPLHGEDGIIEGWRSSRIELDLRRPGFVQVTDTFIALPEKIPNTTIFEAVGPHEEVNGVYMADDASSTALKRLSYLMGDQGAKQVITLLQSASPMSAASEVAVNRLTEALDKMDPGVKEACTRYYLGDKELFIEPEAAFRETRYEWTHLPTQFNRWPEGLLADHADKFIVYAPPGKIPCDSAAAFQLHTEIKDKNLWIKAIWDNDKLPDDYDPLFDEPTSLEAVNLIELAQDLPREAQEHVAQWATNRLEGYKSWIIARKSDVDSVYALDETTFNERMRDSKHFQWSLMNSWAGCLNHILRGQSYEENVAHYEEMEQEYTAAYIEYMEVFADLLPTETSQMNDSLWPSPDVRRDFFEKLQAIDLEFQLKKPS